MTRPEFDAWIETHYLELVKVAGHLGAKEPADVVNEAVARVCSVGGGEPRRGRPITRTEPAYVSFAPEQFWPYATDAVRSVVFNTRSARDTDRTFRRREQAEFRSLAFNGWKQPKPRAD